MLYAKFAQICTAFCFGGGAVQSRLQVENWVHAFLGHVVLGALRWAVLQPRKLTSTTERLNKQIVRAQEERCWCPHGKSYLKLNQKMCANVDKEPTHCKSERIHVAGPTILAHTAAALRSITSNHKCCSRVLRSQKPLQDSDHLRTDLFKMQTSLDMGVKKNKAGPSNAVLLESALEDLQGFKCATTTLATCRAVALLS